MIRVWFVPLTGEEIRAILSALGYDLRRPPSDPLVVKLLRATGKLRAWNRFRGRMEASSLRESASRVLDLKAFEVFGKSSPPYERLLTPPTQRRQRTQENR